MIDGAEAHLRVRSQLTTSGQGCQFCGRQDFLKKPTLWKARSSANMSTDVPAQKVLALSQARRDQSLQTNGSRILQLSVSLAQEARLDQTASSLVSEKAHSRSPRPKVCQRQDVAEEVGRQQIYVPKTLRLLACGEHGVPGKIWLSPCPCFLPLAFLSPSSRKVVWEVLLLCRLLAAVPNSVRLRGFCDRVGATAGLDRPSNLARFTLAGPANFVGPAILEGLHLVHSYFDQESQGDGRKRETTGHSIDP